MSLCDTCLAPGNCCKRVFLSGGLAGFHMQEPMSLERAEHAALVNGLPFVPGAQRPDGTWDWACYHLTESGRCGIYEDRPELCRRYVAGSDPLCVHYWPLEELRPKGLEKQVP